MINNTLLVIAAFLLSMVCGFFFIPQIIRFCKEKGLYDKPDNRKIHHNAIPRLGGLSFLPSMLLASLIVIIVNNQNNLEHQVTLSTWSVTFFFCLLLIYGVGIVDDLVGLGAKTKFAFQTIAAMLLPMSGLYINNLYGFLGLFEIPFLVGAPLTVFIIIFACNAINLIDGIDGLSAGLSLLALTGFLFCFFRERLYIYSVLIAGLMGVLIPFLYYNLWGDEKKGHKIFMGDSGSLTLGFILGFLFVKFTMDNPNVRQFRLDSMMLAYTLLIVPTFDVVRVSLVRLFHRKPIFKADKNHIHHKLMRAGLNQHQTLLCILGLAVSLVIVNLLLIKTVFFSVIVIVNILLWILFNMIVNYRIKRQMLPVFVEVEENR